MSDVWIGLDFLCYLLMQAILTLCVDCCLHPDKLSGTLSLLLHSKLQARARPRSFCGRKGERFKTATSCSRCGLLIVLIAIHVYKISPCAEFHGVLKFHHVPVTTSTKYFIKKKKTFSFKKMNFKVYAYQRGRRVHVRITSCRFTGNNEQGHS